MIGIVIPAHNEQRYLDDCLLAAQAATAHPELGGEPVRIVVALDSCSDRSQEIVLRHAERAAPGCVIDHVSVDARNVGIARAAGSRHLLRHGARWLAFTDADTRVAPDLLAAQLRLKVDVVCGTVAVNDWSPHREDTERLRGYFHHHYNDADGHRHIHGANLGVSAAAYLHAGGFEALICGEDVALVAALERTGARFAWSAAPRVFTSARRDAKARGGFGDTLLRYAASARAESAIAGAARI